MGGVCGKECVRGVYEKRCVGRSVWEEICWERRNDGERLIVSVGEIFCGEAHNL